jgi:integrase
MPRLVNKVPQLKRHISGNARVRHNGKCIYFGRYGTPEADERYKAFCDNLREVKPAEAPAPPPELALKDVPLIGEVVLRYYEHAKIYYVRPDKSLTGEHVTIQCSLRPLTKTFGSLPAREFSPLKLQRLQQEMIKLGWSRNYINKAIFIVLRCFKWAASQELVTKAVYNELESVESLAKGRTAARETAEVGPVADEIVDATLPRVSELVAATCRFMRRTGARPSEAIGMTAAQIDRTDPSCWMYRPGQHKTAHHGKGRVIMIGPEAQQIILPRMMKAGEHGKIFEIKRSALYKSVHRGCRRAFPHPTLSSVADDELTAKQRRELVEWEKAHRWHPNQLRHTFATEVRAKYDAETARVLLGHGSLDMTEIYAERDLTKAQAAARKLG